MPIIAFIDGIKIYMNFQFGEYNPPHIHGILGNNECAVDLNGNILRKGKMKKKDINIVVQFAKNNSEKLKKMWETQNFYKINGEN